MTKLTFKLSIIGIGRVGSQVAFGLVATNAFDGELILIDMDRQKLQGEYLDLLACSHILRSSVRPVIGTMKSLEGSDVVVVASGKARANSFVSMESLYVINKPLMLRTAKYIRNQCPEAKVMVITNPVKKIASLFNGLDVILIEDMLDEARSILDIGPGETIDKKGFSAFGPVAEVLRKLEGKQR